MRSSGTCTLRLRTRSSFPLAPQRRQQLEGPYGPGFAANSPASSLSLGISVRLRHPNSRARWFKRMFLNQTLSFWLLVDGIARSGDCGMAGRSSQRAMMCCNIARQRTGCEGECAVRICRDQRQFGEYIRSVAIPLTTSSSALQLALPTDRRTTFPDAVERSFKLPKTSTTVTEARSLPSHCIMMSTII